MAPVPQEFCVDSSRQDPDSMTGNEVVISGISGLFPKSENVVQFMENLYNQVDMVEPNSPQMSFQHPDMPKFMGKITTYNKFDNQFFKVSHRQAKYMEDYNRKILEEVYSAIFDAGLNPLSLSGGKIGVFIGSWFSDKSLNLYQTPDSTAYVITGCNKSMLANRISYWLDGKAASYAIDQNTASFTVCLEHAYWAIKNGLCDSAIVGGCNQCTIPMLSVNLRKAGVLTLGSKTKCFDKNGDGYVRAEACGTVFLQRAKDAKRIYCEVYHAKEKFFTSPGVRVSSITKSEDLEKFLQEFYSEVDVSPDMVEYIEANALGIAEADGSELKAIGNFFAKNKTIKVGSVKSNMGHGEAASGICSLIKICLAYHTGTLPANLHYNEPQNEIAAVKDGRIQVVTENLPFNRGYVALNSFSFSGVNVHVLLKSYYKPKDKNKYKSSIPRLVVASARTESAVNKIINYLKNKPIDPEEIALLHNIYNTDITAHTARGYVVLNTDKNNKTIESSKSTQTYTGAKRPVWFMYSGMGSQWATMGAALMRIPVFAAAIERCRKTLKPKGVDIVRILTEPDETLFDNILNSFVGIGAVQIGLTDILTELEIVPDNVIGHSVGEVGCAYADGCFTAEETILASYYRGLVSVEAEIGGGAMAAVGLGYRDIFPICPPEIDVACHNSSESCTISGSSEDVKNFVTHLKSRGIFAKEVNTSNIAYHSRYIAPLGDKLRSKMNEFITSPKLRSQKWLSTSVLPHNWGKPEAQYCSADYFTNNLLSSVYFEEVATRIPSDAIIIEVSPHGLMQAILKRSHESCINVPLTKRNHPDSPSFLLDAIGKLYEDGLNPKINALYPKIAFPVSTETPILSHLVEWEHSQEWSLDNVDDNNIILSPTREAICSVHDDKWNFMKDHVRDGIAVVPEAAILFLVWETLGISLNVDYKNLSVCFSKVEFHCAINAKVEDAIKINIDIMKGSGKFEVSWKDLLIATGYVHAYNVMFNYNFVQMPLTEDSELELNSKDVYTIMNLRGHSYGSKMQSIHSCNLSCNKAQVKWNDDWVMLLDSLLQLGALATDHTDVVTPVFIHSLYIDTYRHKNFLCDGKYNAVVMGDEEKIIRNDYMITRCGAVEIKHILFHRKPVITLGNEITRDNRSDIQSDGSQGLKLKSMGCGDLEKLQWIKFRNLKGPAVVQVSHAGITSRDCYKAVGTLSECDSYGMDYSGINERNERVMGAVRSGALATSVEADIDLLWPVPDHWSLEDAATVPMPYLLVYYTLTIRSQIEKHDIILIVDGATALGQAFISVCLDIECNVFTTVSDSEEKKFLLRMFPKLKAENIIERCTTDIKSVVSENTKMSFCRFVVNCGRSVPLEISLKCVGGFGTLLDIIEVPEYKVVGMKNLTVGRNIILVNLPSLLENNHLDEKRLLQLRISDGIARGIVRPLNRVVYSPTDVSKAFRLLSSHQPKGRVLINMNILEMQHHMTSPRTTSYSKGTCVVISGENNIGIQIVDRLVKRGAKNVILQCTNQSGYLRYNIQSWKSSGVSISWSSEDLQNKDSCTKFLVNSEIKGPIHAIFIVEAMKQNFENSAKIDKEGKELVDKINDISSKLCPDLKLFVVIDLASLDGKNKNMLFQHEKTCQLRREKGLPSIHFQFELSKEEIENVEDLLLNTTRNKLSMMFISLEAAIEQVKDVTFGINNEETFVDFPEKITKILGIANVDKCDDKVTLKDLGINNVLLQEIKALIYKVYELNYPIENLQQMTTNSLMMIGEINKNETKTGLDALFSCVEPDEYKAAEPLVVMSKTFKNNFHEENAEIDSTNTYLFMVPGFENHHDSFKCIYNELKIRPVMCQTGLDVLQENIPNMARCIMKNIKQTFKLKTKFYLLGYSFGVNIALELASLLEKEGYTGIVFCLDSSPDALKIQMDEYIGKLNDEALQNAIIEHMYCLFTGRNKEDVESEITNIHEWTGKVEICIQKIKSFATHSHEYIKHTIQGFYDKIKAARNYEPNYKLRSKLVLLKGSRNKNMGLAEDYGLSKYSVQPVRVFNIEKDFVSIPRDYSIAGIINRMIDPCMLEEFK